MFQGFVSTALLEGGLLKPVLFPKRALTKKIVYVYLCIHMHVCGGGVGLALKQQFSDFTAATHLIGHIIPRNAFQLLGLSGLTIHQKSSYDPQFENYCSKRKIIGQQ